MVACSTTAVWLFCVFSVTFSFFLWPFQWKPRCWRLTSRGRSVPWWALPAANIYIIYIYPACTQVYIYTYIPRVSLEGSGPGGIRSAWGMRVLYIYVCADSVRASTCAVLSDRLVSATRSWHPCGKGKETKNVAHQMLRSST